MLYTGRLRYYYFPTVTELLVVDQSDGSSISDLKLIYMYKNDGGSTNAKLSLSQFTVVSSN